MTEHQRAMLAAIINKYNELSVSSLNMMLDNSVIREAGKEEYLAKERKPNSVELFLLEGILQSTVYNEEGDCITTGFYTTGTVLTPHFARTINGRSIFNLQALTDVTVAELPVAILDSLRNSYTDIKLFGLRVVEKELLTSIHHDTSFRALSAKERLQSFRTNYPNLENRIPHTIIASYLGITPVSFSRLRNELAKQ